MCNAPRAPQAQTIWQTTVSASAVCLLIAAVRLLRHLEFHPRVGLVTRALVYAGHSLAHFILVLAGAVLPCAFSSLDWLPR